MEQYLQLYRTNAEYDAESEKTPVSHIVEDVDVKMKGDDPCNRYEYVDLELPSGLLWATKNVGACTEEDCGLLFAWGETQGYGCDGMTPGKPFSYDTYKYYNNGFTKYNASDGKIVLDLEDDAAHVIMGDSWRMPTIEEYQELLNYTTQEPIKEGYYLLYWKLTSKQNPSKFLLLNECGHATSDTCFPQGDGHYWSSSLITKWAYSCASVLWFNSGYIGAQNEYTTRPEGAYIRGVMR